MADSSARRRPKKRGVASGWLVPQIHFTFTICSLVRLSPIFLERYLEVALGVLRLKRILCGREHYRAFSLTWLASRQIYWNKRKRLHKKRLQLPQDWLLHQHNRRFIVLGQQYGRRDVMWQHSIISVVFYMVTNCLESKLFFFFENT